MSFDNIRSIGFSTSMQINSTKDILLIRESIDIECKLAAGRDKKGQLPEDFWKTYSAFANARGGYVLLGINEEKFNKFKAVGITDHIKLRTELFDLLNNKQKVSANVVSDDDVAVRTIDGVHIMIVHIRRASRKEQPIYLGSNPLTGTYRRLHNGDRLCDVPTVKRMLAEQVEDTRDSKILKGFDFECVDLDSLRSYRQALRIARPTHVALESNDVDFLRLINAWKKDRETKDEGLTVAGLLMFGRQSDIWEILPNYVVDYQEQPRTPSTEQRWTDRVTLDGTWSGNLYDFYRRVYRKLIADIKVPFLIKDGRRKDETEVHVSIREALVNSIIHADYYASSSVTIIKKPDMFLFRNPGHMRVPPDIARQGGEGDARNRLLQHMFFLIGASDRAGTGVPTIYKGWKERGWLPPAFVQVDSPADQTRLELRMTDLLPPAVVEHLRQQFGAKFDRLSAEKRLVLATAASEIFITNARIQDICDMHRADITRMLQVLVRDRYLEQAGKTSGTIYFLPGNAALHHDLDDDYDGAVEISIYEDDTSKGGKLLPELGALAPQGDKQSTKSDNLRAPIRGELVTSEAGQLSAARLIGGLEVIDSIEDTDPEVIASLIKIAVLARNSGKLPIDKMKNIVIDLCKNHYITIRTISALILRDERHVRNKMVYPLVAEGALFRAYPNKPNDPRQAYTSGVE